MSSSIQQKAFSRNFFDRQDPTEGIGQLIIPFSFSNIYDDVDKDSKIGEICDELYEKVLAKLNSGELGKDMRFEIYDYKDARQGDKESARRYLVITRETKRKTRITILARFLRYGNKLYVGVDSFILGDTNWLQIIGFTALTILPFSCYIFTLVPAVIQNILASLDPFGNSSSGSAGSIFLFALQYTFCCILPWLIFTVVSLWLNSIRNFRHEGDLLLALRQSFNQILNSRSFNTDDILMTLKSVLPLILSSIREVFQKHNIPVKSLDEFAATVQTVTNIQNIYGSSNAVAGAGGQARIQRTS